MSALWKTPSGKWGDKSKTERKYLQNTYMIKDYDLKYKELITWQRGKMIKNGKKI